MTKDYEPPADAAKVFAQYKEHHEGERELKPQMIAFADRELQAGATVGQLAKLTGLIPEVFRRRARALGIELKRPPTVGKLKPIPAASPPPPAVAAPREQAAPFTPPPGPRRRPLQPVPDPNAVELTEAQTRRMIATAKAAADDQQRERLRRAESTARSLGRDPDLAVIEAAYEMGLLTDADIPPADPA